MTPVEYGTALAIAAGPMSAEQVEQAARLLASFAVEQVAA